MDPDLDPALFFSDFPNTQKISFFFKESKALNKKSQNCTNQGSIWFFCLMMEGSGSGAGYGSVQKLTDPVPGGPKPYIRILIRNTVADANYFGKKNYKYRQPHCKDKMSKIRNENSQKRNIGASVPISTFMCLCANSIFPRWVCLFCWRKYGPILGIYKSLTDTWM